MRKNTNMFAISGVLVMAATGIGLKLNSDRLSADFVHSGDEASTKDLIAGGADLNRTEEMGSTPLMQAARSGEPGGVKTLLDNKVKVDAVDDSGRTALNWSIYMFKLSKDPRYTQISRMLMEKGASVHHKDRQGRTYLINALEAGDFDVAQSLIDRGIDVKPADSGGTTALMCVMKGALTGPQITTMCKRLLEKGADPSKRNRGGKTAYDLAKSQPDRETKEAGTRALASTIK